VTGIETLFATLDAGGKVVPGPDRPRLLTPPDVHAGTERR
jgi:hypothetical protein